MASKISEALGRDMKKHTSKEKKSKEVHHFTVTPAKGGHVVETHFGHSMGEYQEPSTSVHKSMSSVAKHMKACCGEGGGEGGDEEEGMES